MSRTGWKVHYLIREASGRNLVIQPVRDSAWYWFQAFIRSGEFDECIELFEIHTNERGRVVQERVTHSYSKLSGQIVEHVLHPITVKPTIVTVEIMAEEFYSTSLL
jgi:hypothetical protein